MEGIEEVKFSELFHLQPRQKEAHDLVKLYKYLLYGGAAAGGKSYFLRSEAIGLLLYYYAKYDLKGVRIGLFCEDYPALRDRHLSKIPFEFPDWLGSLNKSEHEFTLSPMYGGGVLAFRNLDDTSKYLSSEFAAILIDELTKNKREVFDFLNMRMRWPGIPDTKFIGATNPGSIGHGWVKKLWIDKDFRGEQFDPEEFHLVKAKYTDNKYIDVSYEKQLNSLPEKLRAAYRDGNWDVFEGQFFTDFNREKHVITSDFLKDPATKEWWNSLPVWAGMDYGYAKPSCILWGKYDKNEDKWYIFREIYVTQHDYRQLSIKMQYANLYENDKKEFDKRSSSAIGEMGFLVNGVLSQEEQLKWLKTRKHTTSAMYADPSIFAKKDSPTSGADQMDSEIPIKPAFNDRITGWTILRQYLKDDRLRIFSNCVNLIRTLPEQVYSETHEEDLDTEGEDHAVDALRYLIATHKHILPQTEYENYAHTELKPQSDFAQLFNQDE